MPKRSTTPSPTRAAIYVRISSDPEGQRAGVERQREDCARLAEREGLEVVEVLEDNDVSAYSGKPRPAFEALVDGAQAGDFDVVVAWASDRLYRRLADLVRITADLAPHVQIRTVMGGEVDLETAEGIRNAQNNGVASEFESRRKGERVKARARQRAEDGTATASARPFGWAWADPCPGGSDCSHARTCETDGGRRPRQGSRRGLVPHPVEGALLTSAYAGILAGESLRSVTRWLRDQGAIGTTGRPLESTAVKSALTMPRNAGLVAHRGTIVADAADGVRLVDRGTWEAVRAILTDPARRTSPEARTSTPLGGGLLTCGLCGGPMSASNRHDPRAGTVVPVYACSRPKPPGEPGCYLTRRRALLDGPVLDLARGLLVTLAEAGALVVEAPSSPQAEPVRARIAAAEDRLRVLTAMVADGSLDPVDYAPAAKRIRADLEGLVEQLARREGRRASAALLTDPAGVGAAFDRLVEQGQAGNPDRLRAVLREVFADVVVLPPAVRHHPTAGDVRVTWAAWVPEGAPTSPVVETGAVYLTTEARRAEVLRLHAEGLPGGRIAEAVGVNRSTVVADLRALRAEGLAS